MNKLDINTFKVGRPSRNEKIIASLKEEECKKTSVHLTKDLYKKVKRKALEEDIYISTLITNALTEYLNK